MKTPGIIALGSFSVFAVLMTGAGMSSDFCFACEEQEAAACDTINTEHRTYNSFMGWQEIWRAPYHPNTWVCNSCDKHHIQESEDYCNRGGDGAMAVREVRSAIRAAVQQGSQIDISKYPLARYDAKTQVLVMMGCNGRAVAAMRVSPDYVRGTRTLP